MDQNERPVEPGHQGVPSGLSKMISEPEVHLALTVHLSCIQMDWNEIPHDPHHVGVPSGVSKMIFEPMVLLTVDKYQFYASTKHEKGPKTYLPLRYRGCTDGIPQVLVNIYFCRVSTEKNQGSPTC
jgi:hypothetical protein